MFLGGYECFQLKIRIFLISESGLKRLTPACLGCHKESLDVWKSCVGYCYQPRRSFETRTAVASFRSFSGHLCTWLLCLMTGMSLWWLKILIWSVWLSSGLLCHFPVAFRRSRVPAVANCRLVPRLMKVVNFCHQSFKVCTVDLEVLELDSLYPCINFQKFTK